MTDPRRDADTRHDIDPRRDADTKHDIDPRRDTDTRHDIDPRRDTHTRQDINPRRDTDRRVPSAAPDNWTRVETRARRESRRESRNADRRRAAAAPADRRRVDQPRQPTRVRLPRYDPEVFGRWSETIARYMGTGKFIVYMTVVILAWFGWNTLAPRDMRFDPYTFTFLTLVLSLQASYAAPLILLAQNRQADRDRLALEEDRRRAAMQKADTEYLAREIAAQRIALGEVATRDFLRSELNRLTEDLVEAADRRSKLERKEQRRLARRQGDLSDKPGVPEELEIPDTPRGLDKPTVPGKSGAPDDDAAEGVDTTPDPHGAAGASPSESSTAKKERRAPQGARRATPTS